MANITLLGASYADVPAVDLPQTGGGTVRFYEDGGGSATLITKTITANGTYSAEDDDADGYSEVTVNVPSSAASSWTKVAETTYQVNTTNLSTVTVATWDTGSSELWTDDKWVYIRIRDTEGKRAGYFYGTDNFFIKSVGVRFVTRVDSSGVYINGTYSTNLGYGVFVDTIYSDGRIRIRSRYSSTSSLTINSTYKVEVYLLDPAGGIPIFE